MLFYYYLSSWICGNEDISWWNPYVTKSVVKTSRNSIYFCLFSYQQNFVENVDCKNFPFIDFDKLKICFLADILLFTNRKIGFGQNSGNFDRWYFYMLNVKQSLLKQIEIICVIVSNQNLSFNYSTIVFPSLIIHFVFILEVLAASASRNFNTKFHYILDWLIHENNKKIFAA